MTAPLQAGPVSLTTSFSDLILPYQPKLSHTLASLKKSRLSIHNRLTSIIEDSTFVASVSAVNDLPLVANERCGSWYIAPQDKKGSVYFKSTDGHQGQWKFSLRRLNLNLLEILGSHGGAIVVDSTRRGKSMPDALSKTVPIWAAIMNYLLFPGLPTYHKLVTSEEVVSRSEHALIESRLSAFVAEAGNLQLNLPKLRATLQKPIHVEFISRQSSVVIVHQSTDHTTLIVCSASRHEQGDGDHYVQGAGDDTENWAHGLTAKLFWQHKDQLLSEPNEEQLSDLIARLSHEQQTLTTGSIAQIFLRETPTSIYIGECTSIDQANSLPIDGIILCDVSYSDILSDQAKPTKPPAYLELSCTPGKVGGKTLRDKLHLVSPFISEVMNKTPDPRILIACSTGRDLSVGVALAILCELVGDSGRLSRASFQRIDKSFIRRRLACITDTFPDANPSRATLRSVNTYLMGHDI